MSVQGSLQDRSSRLFITRIVLAYAYAQLSITTVVAFVYTHDIRQQSCHRHACTGLSKHVWSAGRCSRPYGRTGVHVLGICESNGPNPNKTALL